MKKECANYENPENFAKYGKMQRQLVKMEKEVQKLKIKADESQKRPFLEDSKDDTMLIEEAKNVEEPTPAPAT